MVQFESSRIEFAKLNAITHQTNTRSISDMRGDRVTGWLRLAKFDAQTSFVSS